MPGAEQAAFTGPTFVWMRVATRRLWLGMIAHTTFDLTARALIYTNTESAVARVFPRR